MSPVLEPGWEDTVPSQRARRISLIGSPLVITPWQLCTHPGWFNSANLAACSNLRLFGQKKLTVRDAILPLRPKKQWTMGKTTYIFERTGGERSLAPGALGFSALRVEGNS